MSWSQELTQEPNGGTANMNDALVNLKKKKKKALCCTGVKRSAVAGVCARLSSAQARIAEAVLQVLHILKKSFTSALMSTKMLLHENKSARVATHWRVVNNNWKQPPEALLYNIESLHYQRPACCCCLSIGLQRHFCLPVWSRYSFCFKSTCTVLCVRLLTSCRYSFHQPDCHAFTCVQSVL